MVDIKGYKLAYVSDTYGKGGQHTNGPDYGVFRCEHADTRTAVEIHSSEAGSPHRARELALTLCALAVESLPR